MWQVNSAAKTFGPYMLGMTKADARYQFGAPQGSDPGASNWNYLSAGSRISLGFGADGRLAQVTCFQEESYEGPCPQSLGVGIGSAEGDLTRLLGPAAAVRYDREDKIIRYPALGLVVRLRKLRVVGIQHSAASGTAGLAKVALWRMLP